MTRLTLIRGGSQTPPVASHLSERVMAPGTAMALRAGLTPVIVPADMWIDPALLARLAPEAPRLRVVA